MCTCTVTKDFFMAVLDEYTVLDSDIDYNSL